MTRGSNLATRCLYQTPLRVRWESLEIAENADQVAELQEIEAEETLSQESTSACGWRFCEDVDVKDRSI